MEQRVFEAEVVCRLHELIERCHIANCGNGDKYKIRFAGHVHSLELVRIGEDEERHTTQLYLDVMQDRNHQGILDVLDGLISTIPEGDVTNIFSKIELEAQQQLFEACYLINNGYEKELVGFEYHQDHRIEVKLLGKGTLKLVALQYVYYTNPVEYTKLLTQVLYWLCAIHNERFMEGLYSNTSGAPQKFSLDVRHSMIYVITKVTGIEKGKVRRKKMLLAYDDLEKAKKYILDLDPKVIVLESTEYLFSAWIIDYSRDFLEGDTVQYNIEAIELRR